MNYLTTICLAVAMSPGTTHAVEPLLIPGNGSLWEEAVPVSNKSLRAYLLDAPSQTQVKGFIRPPAGAAVTAAEVRTEVVEFFQKPVPEERVDLRIDWTLGDAVPKDFTRTLDVERGIARSRFRVGMTTITRTVLASAEDEAVFIHLLANQPGALSFRVSVECAGTVQRMEDRRQMILTPEKPEALGAHVWVLPFESDVETVGKSITVRGEGEALIVCAYAAGADAARTLAGTVARLGNRFDPDHTPADPSKIWHGVLDSRLKSVENSP